MYIYIHRTYDILDLCTLRKRKQNLGEMAGDMAAAMLLVAPGCYQATQIHQVPLISQGIRRN
jgi:hypothetical protein